MNFFKRAVTSVVSDVREKHEQSQERKRILGLLSYVELKLIVSSYGIGLPSLINTDMISGKHTKRDLVRKDYVDSIAKEMSLNQLRAYCKKKKISIGGR